MITVSALADRAKTPPWGLFGGQPGSKTRLELQRAGETSYRTFQEQFGVASPSKFANLRLRRGDRVRLVSPSGGGYGDPLMRDPDAVAWDVREGFVSRSTARETYGVVLDPDGRVDRAATDERRVSTHAARTGPA